jgi:hypothetical protein
VVGWLVTLSGCALACFIVTREGMFCGMLCALVMVAGTFFWGGVQSGLAQWLLLRRYLPRAGWWTLASAFGWVGAAVVGLQFGLAREWAPLGANSVAMLLLAGCMFGAARGVIQWLILRKQASRAGWWVLTSTLGWSALPLVTCFLPDMDLGWWVAALGAGGLFGVISSPVISGLLGRQQGVRERKEM